MQNDRPMFGNAKSLPVKSLPVQNSLYSTVHVPRCLFTGSCGGVSGVVIIVILLERPVAPVFLNRHTDGMSPSKCPRTVPAMVLRCMCE
jgi:hypothetical protein